jgi:hypothetical protein
MVCNIRVCVWWAAGNKRHDVKYGLGGDDGFDKRASSGGRDVLPMPRDKLEGRLVNEGLHNNIFDTYRSEKATRDILLGCWSV